MTTADRVLGEQRYTGGDVEREERVAPRERNRLQEAIDTADRAQRAAAKIRAAVAAQSVKAKVRKPPPITGMNKLERRYSEHLDLLKVAGEVADWRFEALTVKLAIDVRYTPDFMVLLPSGALELHETKGFLRDDARVKLRIAARMFPWFVFRLVRWGKGVGGWEIEEVTQ